MTGTVGHSRRTPAKHALMSSIYGREVGVANKSGAHSRISRLVWMDLTAGDGIPVDGSDWRRDCSPGINAYHATFSEKPVDVSLYEIQDATYDRLISSLEENLPSLGYRRVDDETWQTEIVTLRAICGSGSAASIDGIRKKTDSVLVSNDPNAITTWAMRPSFAEEIAARAWSFRCISTMGCNAAGLKRLDVLDRLEWFDLVKQQESAVPSYRDLMLASIERDSSQWAYLLCEPVKWRDSVEATVRSAFGNHGYSMEMAWYKAEPESFESMKERLFLRPTERRTA